ncbi:hypothetical protein RND81_05G059900 [Saponaria officinalis]|uniref:Embryo sac development arrest 6 n=1 Tax=Saponaria officinalis TaxID=3572 RepID=A0AAW1KVV8_SAPOF
MNHTSRGLITAVRKRKDREDSSFYNHKGNFVNNKKHQYFQPPNKINSSSIISSAYNNHSTTSYPGSSRVVPEPGLGSSNRVLAGYMAYEFLTKGTLFGQKFDPARAEAIPVSAAEPKRKPGSSEPVGVKPSRSYAEVAQLLKGEGGAHIPGVVNPTQLARWIQM